MLVENLDTQEHLSGLVSCHVSPTDGLIQNINISIIEKFCLLCQVFDSIFKGFLCISDLSGIYMVVLPRRTSGTQNVNFSVVTAMSNIHQEIQIKSSLGKLIIG